MCRDGRSSASAESFTSPGNTIRKILRSNEISFAYERERQPKPKIGPWQEKLDALLDGNRTKPDRERLTLVRIYEELVGDESVAGGEFRRPVHHQPPGRARSWIGP